MMWFHDTEINSKIYVTGIMHIERPRHTKLHYIYTLVLCQCTALLYIHSPALILIISQHQKCEPRASNTCSLEMSVLCKM